MPPRSRPGTRLPAPFLKRLWVDGGKVPGEAYPFNLPWLARPDFELTFTQPVTIIVGENGSGKSTLIEAIAAYCGYDSSGGGKGYRVVDHSRAVETDASALAEAFQASWLPRVTSGWFFKAESFFSVARGLDVAAMDANAPPPEFLSMSHGEGFSRLFGERMNRQGLYFMDEPESALSPRRQLQLLALLADIQRRAVSQVIMATHSPILVAVPGAALLEIGRRGLQPVSLRETDHFRLYQDFITDPEETVSQAIRDAEAD